MVIDHWFPFFQSISVVSTCQRTRQTLHGVDVAVDKGDAMLDAWGTQGVNVAVGYPPAVSHMAMANLCTKWRITWLMEVDGG